MPRSIQLDGVAAIEYLLARAGPFLAQQWDGTLERVAFIVEGAEGQMQGGYLMRSDATAEVRRRMLEPQWERFITPLSEILAAIDSGPTTGGVQCILLGWGGCNIIEVNPEDLRNAPHLWRPVSDDDLAKLFDACSERHSASALLSELCMLWLAEREQSFAELDALADAVEQGWDDVSKIALVAGRARAASDDLLSTRLGQRTREAIDMLIEATAKRAGGTVNARGGSA